MDIMHQLIFLSTLHYCETTLSSEGKQRDKSPTNQSSAVTDSDWMPLLPCLQCHFIALRMTSFSVTTEPHFNTRKVPPNHAQRNQDGVTRYLVSPAVASFLYPRRQRCCCVSITTAISPFCFPKITPVFTSMSSISDFLSVILKIFAFPKLCNKRMHVVIPVLIPSNLT